MNLRGVAYLSGWLLLSLAAALLVPAGVSLLLGGSDGWVFVATSCLVGLFGVLLVRVFRQRGGIEFGRHDAFVLVSLAWAMASVVGAMPWVGVYGLGFGVDALFESASGFTTTGASILTTISNQPPGLLLWRSLTQWLGGMGIIVLGIAILPRLASGGMELLSAEAPGPVQEKLTPRIAQTAKALWVIYVAMTVALWIILWVMGMDWFESLNHALTTLSTGGFSIHDRSVAGYGHAGMEWAITVFMFLAGVNFALHFQLLRGWWRRPARDPELRSYGMIVLVISVIIVIDLMWAGGRGWESIRLAFFQVVSVGTTTGFATDNYDAWPPLSRALLFSLMFVGGCAGSTSGSVKVVRYVIMFRKLRADLRQVVQPHAVVPVRLGSRVMPTDVVSSVVTFLALFVVLFVVGGLGLSAMGLDLVSAFSASIACLGNIGPGFGVVGAVENYASLDPQAKLLLVGLMVIGRLELYTVLSLPFLLNRR